MAADFGWLLTAGPLKGAKTTWLDDIDTCLSHFGQYVKSLWMSDHFFWEDMPTYEVWTVMSYLAARYPQYDVGAGVLGQSYRNPALTAKMAATLQDLSGGRFIMGIGAGWKADEYLAYHYDFPATKIRIEQLEDTLEIMKRLWTEPGKVTYEGKHYNVVGAYCEPKPNPVPPIVIGAGGNKTMRVTARYADIWNFSDANLQLFQERLAVIKGHCADIGRDFNTLRLSWLGRLVVGRTHEEAVERAYREGFYHYKDWTIDHAFVGTAAEVVKSMREFMDVGVDYFMCEIFGLPDSDVIDMMTNEVLPQITR